LPTFHPIVRAKSTGCPARLERAQTTIRAVAAEKSIRRVSNRLEPKEDRLAIGGIAFGAGVVGYSLYWFFATSVRYQRRIVSGVTMPARPASRRRPSTVPFTARRRLVVGEAQPPRPVRCAQDSVLFEQIVNDGLLVDPAGEDQNEERERRR